MLKSKKQISFFVTKGSRANAKLLPNSQNQIISVGIQYNFSFHHFASIIAVIYFSII
jgi:hypothetical protein